MEDTILRRETDRELALLLAALPDDQRTAVVLRHVIDLPVAEIAEILGRPPGTVKSDITRGRRRLAQALLAHRPPDHQEIPA